MAVQGRGATLMNKTKFLLSQYEEERIKQVNKVSNKQIIIQRSLKLQSVIGAIK